ncbi:MAG: spore germination protein [Ruminococcaceae bacterium]|nr:spore germination protein [Oscillospiraceae bacterium]
MAAGCNDYSKTELSESLSENLIIFRNIFKKDAILRTKNISANGREYAVLYMDGMVNVAMLNDSVVRPLVMVDIIPSAENLAESVSKQILFASEVKKTNRIDDALRAILYGDTLLLIDGSRELLIINTKGWRTRGISEPENERILQGPREGFDEAALLNIAMIRRKLLTPDFCVEIERIGRRTDTIVFICYLDSLVDAKILKELKRRLSKIDIDGILDTNYIAEQIRDNRYSLFKTTGSTERPDIAAAALLEGRIALVVDGTPVVMTLPYLFSQNFQSDEDYYINFFVASVGRFLRYICFFLSISVPSVFISLITFHKELLPTTFAVSIAELRGGVPFSSVGECLMLIFIFEILRETGVRMSQSVGHALSIVGGLVIGQAAVEAKIVSAPILIVVAFSGISGLMVPRLKGAVFYLRVLSLIASALFGLYGYIAFMTILFIHIFSLSSFSVDYTVSLNYIKPQSLKDTLFRAAWFVMKKRPLFNKNLTRMGEHKNK